MQLNGETRRRSIGCFGASSLKLQVDHENESRTESAKTETKTCCPPRKSRENSADPPKTDDVQCESYFISS